LAIPSTKKRPSAETERLILRPFELGDAPRVKLLAGDRDIAAMTLNVPHPDEDGMAEKWIGSHQDYFEKGEQVVFAITLKPGGELIGAIGLILNLAHEKAELGYWIGKPYWGHGYCTEAARAALRYAFTDGGLNRVHAYHFHHNPASGRVMQKLGMKYEGRLRQHVKKWGQFIDNELYCILRSDFDGTR
jgi:[ribosomal protein S5]-alanine N-acetyltransferase